MIYGDDEKGYTISSQQMWLPGIYATATAARAAFQLDWAVLQQLSDAVCKQGGRIASEDLRAASATPVTTDSRDNGGQP